MSIKNFRGAVLRRKQATTPKTLDVEPILRALADLRMRLPFVSESAPPPVEDTRTRSFNGRPMQTAEDFEYAALKDAAGSLHADLTAVLTRLRDELLEESLETYYATEELARDPANAHLLEPLKMLREAYEEDYGRPIPPKGTK